MLLLLGPEVIFGLTIAIFLGIFIGTYSSIYISSPVLVWLGVKPDSFVRDEEKDAPEPQPLSERRSATAKLCPSMSRLACPEPTLMRSPCVKLTRTAALLLACRRRRFPLAGCAGNKAKRDTAYVARDVNTLYGPAKERLDKGDYEQAAKLFDEVERQHPYSVWARRAQLMSAFSYYMAQKYPEAISSAQRFLTIHPGNKDAPYAHYLIAHELLSADRGRHARPDDHAAGARTRSAS